MFALIGQLHNVFSLDFFFTAEGAGCGGGELMWIISLDLFQFLGGGGNNYFSFWILRLFLLVSFYFFDSCSVWGF